MFLAFRFSYTRYKFQAFMATFLSVTLIGDPRVICLLLVKVFMATFVSVRLISFRPRLFQLDLQVTRE